MGRVLAHELFHVFANTYKHGHDGVGKTIYSRKDLVAEALEFDAQEAQRIQRR
jgi:Zn-dependent peptidase ImmA (M78 family)